MVDVLERLRRLRRRADGAFACAAKAQPRRRSGTHSPRGGSPSGASYWDTSAGARIFSDCAPESHFLLHISQTEGFPQVLLEAFAAGLPVVATDVGGIGDAVGDAALLVPPQDAEAPVNSLNRISADDAARQRSIEAGFAFVRAHTIDAETERVASFIGGD